jgi:hypothetical protein
MGHILMVVLGGPGCQISDSAEYPGVDQLREPFQFAEFHPKGWLVAIKPTTAMKLKGASKAGHGRTGALLVCHWAP